LAAVLGLLEVGGRLGARAIAHNTHGTSGTSAMEGAVFALLGLLLAFTFFGAASRFDDRRTLIVEETNAIGTAYLRLDLLPASAQPELRDTFRRYLDQRLAVYRALPDIEASNAALARANEMQQQIWTKAVAGSTAPGSHPDAGKLLLPALNEMIDITTTRAMAGQMHPPPVVFGLLVALMLVSALLAGYAMAAAKVRNWLYRLTFAFTLAGAAYVILDFEYPRFGLIRVDSFDQALVDLRQSMK
ncbi:MAG: DUF4239 domain-containing protein, partial [Burkholderiaceae bacterium]|nr:DUF4239 domain-containing protein [Burkholderiaceae bacterium]